MQTRSPRTDSSPRPDALLLDVLCASAPELSGAERATTFYALPPETQDQAWLALRLQIEADRERTEASS